MGLRDGFRTLPQRHHSPNDIRSLISAYRGGPTTNELAARYDIHRTTVTALLDQHQVPRHSARTNGSDDELRTAAEQYGSGMSLAEVATAYGIDAQTVANRFRRAGIPIRPRHGWPSRHTAHWNRSPGPSGSPMQQHLRDAPSGPVRERAVRSVCPDPALGDAGGASGTLGTGHVAARVRAVVRRRVAVGR